jgi:hypothetical protein
MHGDGYVGHDGSAGVFDDTADRSVEGLGTENSARSSEGQQQSEDTKGGKNSFASTLGSADDIGAQTGGYKKGRDGAIHRGSADLAFVVETADGER